MPKPANTPSIDIPKAHYTPFRMAFKESRKSTNSLFYHGSVVIQGGNIISKAANRNMVHAEVGAIKRLHPSKRHDLIVWSLRSSGAGRKVCASKPCDECVKFMTINGVKGVYYSTALGTIEYMEINN